MPEQRPENPNIFPGSGQDRSADFTLRDLFAAAALAGMARATEAYENDSIQRRATLAYAYADAMLKAREATP